MKKLLMLCTLSLFLTSCGDPIDNKVRLDDEESIQKIQENYKDIYSQEDFNTASDAIASTMMRKMLTSGEKETPKFTLEKTYRDFLDEAKENRIQKEQKQAQEQAEKERLQHELQEKRQALMDAVNIVVIEQNRITESTYDVSFLVTAQIQNKTQKDIAGFTGKMEVYDMFQKKVSTLRIQEDETLSAETSKNEKWAYDVSFNDDIKRLSDEGIQKLSFSWLPEKIIFSDGSILAIE